MNAAKLENWSVIGRGDPYTPPELWTQCLEGEVYGHPRIADGERIVTSAVTAFDLKARTASTRNTAYMLGEPDPAYVEAYPDRFKDYAALPN